MKRIPWDDNPETYFAANEIEWLLKPLWLRLLVVLWRALWGTP